jgi:hypothetical protein
VVPITPLAKVVGIRSGPSLSEECAGLFIWQSVLQQRVHVEEAADGAAIEMVLVELRLVLAGLCAALSIEARLSRIRLDSNVAALSIAVVRRSDGGVAQRGGCVARNAGLKDRSVGDGIGLGGEAGKSEENSGIHYKLS